MPVPRPYQIVGRDFLAGRRFALLADEMRVGKTPQAILACAKLDAPRVLVVCPAIAVPQWHDEFAAWWPGRRHTEVVSYDKAKARLADLVAEPWTVAIVDEAHFAKNPEAARTKMVYGKDGLGWHTDHLWALTGTPAPKHAAELWPMLRAFGVTELSYWQFANYYCNVIPGTTRITGTKLKRIPELRALLAKIMLRRMRKEVAPDMPAIGYNFLNISTDNLTDLKGVPLDEAGIERWMRDNAARLEEDRVAVAMAKVKPLADQIEFAIENKLLAQTVVFGWHIDALREMSQELMRRNILCDRITGATTVPQRTAIRKEFQAGHLKVVCVNIAAAGTAIDLSAASHGYFLELDWVPGNNVQAANRLVSMQKDTPVTMDIVTWKGSADDRVQRILLRRSSELAKLY